MIHPEKLKRDLLAMSFNVASFFAAAGGLDLGLYNAGFDLILHHLGIGVRPDTSVLPRARGARITRRRVRRVPTRFGSPS